MFEQNHQVILKQKNKTPLKAQILMLLGNGFLERGHATQSAYYYGIILREYTETSHVPNALYYLGKSMEELAESEKQLVAETGYPEKFVSLGQFFKSLFACCQNAQQIFRK